MSVLWALRAAAQSRKAKRFWKMLEDPKKRKRWIDKVNQIKNRNKAKAIEEKTGQKSFDFNQGGHVPKYLAGGLLSKGIRLIYKDPRSKAAINKLATWVKQKYKVDTTGKLGTLGKLELKKRKAEGLVKYSKLLQDKIVQNPKRFKNVKQVKQAKNVFKKTELQAEAYKKKVNLITKTLIRRKPNVTFHSEGGEVVFGKNVDKDLL